MLRTLLFFIFSISFVYCQSIIYEGNPVTLHDTLPDGSIVNNLRSYSNEDGYSLLTWDSDPYNENVIQAVVFNQQNEEVSRLSFFEDNPVSMHRAVVNENIIAVAYRCDSEIYLALFNLDGSLIKKIVYPELFSYDPDVYSFDIIIENGEIILGINFGRNYYMSKYSVTGNELKAPVDVYNSESDITVYQLLKTMDNNYLILSKEHTFRILEVNSDFSQTNIIIDEDDDDSGWDYQMYISAEGDYFLNRIKTDKTVSVEKYSSDFELVNNVSFSVNDYRDVSTSFFDDKLWVCYATNGGINFAITIKVYDAELNLISENDQTPGVETTDILSINAIGQDKVKLNVMGSMGALGKYVPVTFLLNSNAEILSTDVVMDYMSSTNEIGSGADVSSFGASVIYVSESIARSPVVKISTMDIETNNVNTFNIEHFSKNILTYKLLIFDNNKFVVSYNDFNSLYLDFYENESLVQSEVLGNNGEKVEDLVKTADGKFSIIYKRADSEYSVIQIDNFGGTISQPIDLSISDNSEKLESNVFTGSINADGYVLYTLHNYFGVKAVLFNPDGTMYENSVFSYTAENENEYYGAGKSFITDDGEIRMFVLKDNSDNKMSITSILYSVTGEILDKKDIPGISYSNLTAGNISIAKIDDDNFVFSILHGEALNENEIFVYDIQENRLSNKKFIANRGIPTGIMNIKYYDNFIYTFYSKHIDDFRRNDDDLLVQKYSYDATLGVQEIHDVPAEYSLDNNYPNPYNPSTTITYSLPESGNVKIEVFNMLGQSVGVLYEGYTEAGSHNITFNAGELVSGVYIYRFTTSDFSASKKMLLVK